MTRLFPPPLQVLTLTKGILYNFITIKVVVWLIIHYHITTHIALHCIAWPPHVITTLIIPSSARGLIVRVQISEVDTRFLYPTKSLPPKDLGSIVHPDTTH